MSSFVSLLSIDQDVPQEPSAVTDPPSSQQSEQPPVDSDDLRYTCYQYNTQY